MKGTKGILALQPVSWYDPSIVQTGTCISGLLLAHLLIVATKAAPKTPYFQGKAIIRAIRGTASYNVRNSGFRPLKVGMIFTAGTIIRTAPDAQVDLYIQNVSSLRLTADTELILARLAFQTVGEEVVAETQLDLKSGRILGNVKKMTAASRYEVKTPRGICALRESKFDIRADGTITLLTGTAIVAYFPRGDRVATVSLGPNQQTAPPKFPDYVPAVTSATPDPAEFPPDFLGLSDPSFPEPPLPPPPPPIVTLGEFRTPTPFVSPITGLLPRP